MSKILAAVYLAKRFWESPDIVDAFLNMSATDTLALEVLLVWIVALMILMIKKFRK